jgi:hypothetical protein
MNSTQTVDLHDVDAYFKSRNLVDDKHRPYCLRWLQRYLSGPWETLQGTSLSTASSQKKICHSGLRIALASDVSQ